MADTVEVPIMKISNVVTVRQVPMNSKGCDNLRTIRDYQVNQYKLSTGKGIEIPFPSAIHLALEDYLRRLKDSGDL